MYIDSIEELKQADAIECAPNGILGVFERDYDTNKWRHIDADKSCASYTDEEIFNRCGKSIKFLN